MHIFIICVFHQKSKNFKILLSTVSDRGEIGREVCEISPLVEHMGLSPWLFL